MTVKGLTTTKTCAMRCELLVVAMTMHMRGEKRSGRRYDFGESANVSLIVLRSETSLVYRENERNCQYEGCA